MTLLNLRNLIALAIKINVVEQKNLCNLCNL